jgi:hypothetical protein
VGLLTIPLSPLSSKYARYIGLDQVTFLHSRTEGSSFAMVFAPEKVSAGSWRAFAELRLIQRHISPQSAIKAKLAERTDGYLL